MAAVLAASGTPARAVTTPPGFVIDNPWPGVTFNQPLQVVFAPDGRRFVVEKTGTVDVMTAEGVKLSAPFIDLTMKVISTGDRGLMSMALDPDFEVTGWFYLLYSVDPDSDGVGDEGACWGRIERYRALANDPNVADLASREVLVGTSFADGFPLPTPQRNHVVGTLRFGRDGSLLAGCGDAANAGTADPGGLYPEAFGPGLIDPAEDIGAYRAQSIHSLAGKILRLDRNTGHGLPSNPFWDGNPVAACSRVWLYGLRNPFRFSIKPGSGSTDPADGSPGTLFIADVGWFSYEELSIADRGGLNLGWPCVEGPSLQPIYQQLQQPPDVGCGSYGSSANPASPTGPAAWWTHSSAGSSYPPGEFGTAIVAGAYYTGTSYPASHRNALFVADYGRNWVWTLELNANDQVVGGAPFALTYPDTPVDLEIEPETGDVWYVSIQPAGVRRIRYATGNHDPFLQATVTPNYGPAPLAVTFDAGATTDADADPLAFRWLFGDGAEDTSRVTSHVYGSNGIYPVSLSVRDGQGGLDSLSFTVVVGATPPPGEIVLPSPGTFYDTNDVVPLQAVPVDEGAGPVTYRWDVDLLHFAHSNHVHESQYVEWGPNAEFVFDASGNLEPTGYRVRLTVTQAGLTTRDTVEVHARQDIAAGPLTSPHLSPHVGRVLPLTATLRAGGGIGEFETVWRLVEGGTTLAEGVQPPLGPGDSAVFVIPVAGLTAGSHVLTLVADADGKRFELDESNNSATLEIRVRGEGEPFATWVADSAAGATSLPADSPGPWMEGVNGLNGVLTGYSAGEPRWLGAGVAGDPAYLAFDGGTEHVRLAPAGGAPFLQPPLLAASAEIWFRPGADVTRAQQLIHWADGLTEPRTGLSLALANGRLEVDALPVRDVGPVRPHDWTHVIVSAGVDSLRVYVNGARSFTDTYANLGVQWTELLLGAASAVGAGVLESHFAGHVGEVRLYEDELGDAQAAARHAARAAYYRAAPAARERILAVTADSAIAGAPAPVPGAASPWEDRSGHGHDLTLENFSPISDTSGWAGSGGVSRLEFDGVDDVATLPPDALGELATGDPVTVTLWVRTGRDVQREQALVEWRDSVDPNAPRFRITLGEGSFRFGSDGAHAIAPAAPGRWYHVVVSTAPDHAAAWLDGVPVWTRNAPTGAAQHTTLALGGPATGAPGTSFRGAVARFEIWRGSFTDAEVGSLHATQAGTFPHRVEFAVPGPVWVSSAQPCVGIPLRFARPQGPPLRSVSVTLRLPAGFQPCGETVAGPAFAGVSTVINETEPEPGRYRVDVSAASCAGGDGSLFTLPLDASIAAEPGSLEIASVIVRDCNLALLAVDLGSPLELRVDTAEPVAPGPVSASPDLNATAPDGRVPLRLSFAIAADAESVAVYRAPYGNAPEYDDEPDPGQPPAPPAGYPPGAPWERTAVSAPGRTDMPAVHDAWTYIAYAFDAAGNRSPVSPAGNERVNYRLGDVCGAAGTCAGDGLVGPGDVAGLAGAYGDSLSASDPLACLDVGPTADGSIAGRPLTDDRLDFEDLMIVALDHDATATGPAPASNVDVLSPALTNDPAIGDTVNVDVMLAGSGHIHGLSLRLAYDAARVAPAGVRRGTLLGAHALPSVVLWPGGAMLDLALLGKGPGIFGNGQLASMKFVRTAPGLLDFSLTDVRARDAQNQPVALEVTPQVGVPVPPVPQRVALSPGAPSPFRNDVTFQLALPRAGRMRLGAYDVAGRLVRMLADGPWPAGMHRITWDGRDRHGALVAPGVYFVSLELERRRTTRRIVRLR